VYQGHDYRRKEEPAPQAGDERTGLGCSPGVVRGPVRIVLDPTTADLDHRAILVAEHTDPGWIMVFPSARGVLVERGSLLSHAAIVARELGIPAIVSLPGLTRWLRDEDWVEMDGATGVVRRIAPSPDHAQ
jgi:pyruvate,water dikinase